MVLEQLASHIEKINSFYTSHYMQKLSKSGSEPKIQNLKLLKENIETNFMKLDQVRILGTKTEV